MQRRYTLTALFSGLVLAGSAIPANGQLQLSNLPGAPTALSDAKVPSASPSGIKQQRKDVADRLRIALRQLDAEKQNGKREEPEAEQLQEEVASLKQLEVVLAEQQAAEDRKKTTAKENSELEARLNQLRSSGPAERSPIPLLLLDQLRDELLAESARKDAVEDTVKATDEALLRAKAALEDKERRRRQAKEVLDTNKDETAKANLTANLAQAELSSRLASEIVKLHESEAATAKLAQQLYNLRVTYLQEKAEWIGKDTSFTDKDLQQQMVELEKQERDLKRNLEAAEASVPYLEQQWFDARRRLDISAVTDPVLTAEVEARQLTRLAQQQKITVFGERLARLEDRRQVWSRRLKIAQNKATKQQRGTWSEETQQKLDQLDRERRLQAIRIDEVRKDQATLASKIESDPQRLAELTRWLQDQQRQFGELLNLHEQNIASIDASRRIHEKLLREIRESEPEMTLRDHLANLWESAAKIWNHELASVDDRPITVKKIVTGVLLLFVGYLLSRVISRLFGGRFLPRVGVHPSAAAAFQSVLFYTLIVLFAVFALKVVNVPLTAFTLLGGALALGIGFGSQNVINNFISGLILLAERSVKVGDLIQLDGLYGTVEHIGARSTRVKTGANHEIIVPNSSFLENNVVNWTLSDDRIRTVIKVGVIYGSPTREVTRLIAKAVADHGLFLPRPEPIILFTDFGDNSLNFEIHFWIKMRTLMERMRIESDVRYHINQLFREAGLVIAFPQRDVHLDSIKPIEVRLVADAPDSQGQEPPEALPKSA